MAWTDQCKIAFMANAEHQVFTQKGRKNITKVLKKLSQESGIPFKTLERWYYEKEKSKEKLLSSLKNEGITEQTENKEDNENSTPCTLRPICIKCKKNPVELDNKSGKSKSPKNKYYGLCQNCRKKAKVINDAIALANKEDDGEWIICPECNHHFLY